MHKVLDVKQVPLKATTSKESRTPLTSSSFSTRPTSLVVTECSFSRSKP